jgi:F0F1-type ATP synthase assembly protein I
MIAFTLLGLGIDYLAGSIPWATVVFTLLGLVAAMAHLIRMASTATRKPDGASQL